MSKLDGFVSGGCLCSKKQFEPVWAEITKNYPLRKLELLTPQNAYIGHKVVIWQIKGIPIFVFRKCLIWFEVWFKKMEMFKVWVKIAILDYNKRIFFGIFLFKFFYSCFSTLYLLDLFGFGPISVHINMQNYPVIREWSEANWLDPPNLQNILNSKLQTHFLLIFLYKQNWRRI